MARSLLLPSLCESTLLSKHPPSPADERETLANNSMLLGMYFNLPVLLAIFFGHTFGYLAFGRDTCGDALIDSGCAC